MHILYIDKQKIRQKQFEQEAAKIHEIQSIRMFDTIAAARRYCTQEPVDLVFVALQATDSDQIGFIRELQNLQIPFAFAGTEAQYSKKIFRSGALHYLLIPVDAHNIRICLERIRETAQSRTEPLSIPRRILVKSGPKFIVLELSEILSLSGAGSYTDIRTLNGDHYVSAQTLGKYALKLRHHRDFLRIHRSHIVNLCHVKTVVLKGHQYYVQLTDNTERPVSAGMKDRIFSALE